MLPCGAGGRDWGGDGGLRREDRLAARSECGLLGAGADEGTAAADAPATATPASKPAADSPAAAAAPASKPAADAPATAAAPASKPAADKAAAAPAKPLSAEAQAALARITKLVGKVKYDAHQNVADIDLDPAPATDADLGLIARGFPNLARLTVSGADITDVGVKQLANISGWSACR